MPVRLNGSTSGFAAIDAPATAGNNTLVLPTGNGSNRQSIVGDGSGGLSFQWAAGSLFYRLNSDIVGLNQISPAQSIFGVGANVAASTVYEFQGFYLFTKSSGTTTHNFRLGFSLSTATINNISYIVQAATAGSSPGVASPAAMISDSTTAQTTVVSSIASASYAIGAMVRGTVSINAAGTFVPTFDITATGGAYRTNAGSYFALTPIGAAGSASSQGTWS